MVGRTWRDADFRVSFAKNKTHTRAWYTLCIKNIYGALPIDRYPITWTTLARGGAAYAHSVAYDLRVLADYVTRFVAGDALVIVLGDHQPVAEVTGFSPSHAVPVHVISRRRAFVDPFLARGYLPGMRPRRTATPPAGRTGASTRLVAASSTLRSVMRTASVSNRAGKHQPVSS